MAFTAQLEKYQSIIWQDEGDGQEALLISPEASGNLTWCNIQQRAQTISVNLAGAKELIKELQWYVRNEQSVIDEHQH